MLSAEEYALHATQSFTLPQTCVQLRRLLDNDKSDSNDIAKIISNDPVLGAKLLKLANSALFRFEYQIDDIDKAITVVGGEALYNLMMAETASSAFEHFSNDAIDLQRFWLQSVYAGLVAKHLAKIARIRTSGRYFVIGLLHNIGELIVAVNTPNFAAQCAQYSTEVPPWERQKHILGFCYTDCTHALLKQWNLPLNLYQALPNTHSEMVDCSQADGLMFIVYRAALVLVEPEKFNFSNLIPLSLLQKMGLTEQDIIDSMKFAQMEAATLISVLRS